MDCRTWRRCSLGRRPPLRLNVFQAFLLVACTFGLVNSWGVFQEHYQQVVLPHVSPSTLYVRFPVYNVASFPHTRPRAWIGSVQYSLVFMPGLLVGRLFDLGWFHETLITASCLLVVATFLVAECHEFWQFMLAQGEHYIPHFRPFC